METKTAGARYERVSRPGNARAHAIIGQTAAARNRLDRRLLLQNILGRTISAAVATAVALRADGLVDRLLSAKDLLNRRRGRQ